MSKSSLLELIKSFEYGTHLKICVGFFGTKRNHRLLLPHEYSIHTGQYCWKLKESKPMADRCYICRKLALRKALTTRQAFFGHCINGVFEYTHPVIVDNKVIAIIFIGNILNDEGKDTILSRIKENQLGDDAEHLLSSFERDIPIERCRIIGDLIEDYIITQLSLYPADEDVPAANTIITDIQTYIEENLCENISIKSIASLFHYNEKYFGRLFKKNFNCSMNLYICKKRIEKACHLLKTTKRSITEIATRTGFENVTYFNRKFKQLIGITPGEFRLNSKNKSANKK